MFLESVARRSATLTMLLHVKENFLEECSLLVRIHEYVLGLRSAELAV